MPISFPINLPTSPTARQITFKPRSAVSASASPLTFQPQSYVWSGQLWTAEVQLPPMARANAEAWVAALVSLNASEGSFLLGDTANKTMRGSGLAAPIISPSVLNGGFETAGGGGADVFANWTELLSGASTLVDETSLTHGGGHACKLNASGGYAQVNSSYSLTIGARYRLSFWARDYGTSTALTISTGTVHLLPSLTSSYANYSTDFVATGATMQVYAYNPCLIDDVTLTPLDGNGVLVKGASQTGYDLITDGWSVSKTGVVKAGDWLQLGTGTTARLYKVMADANSNGSGEATLTLWPKLRTSPADNAAVTFSSPMGKFMLAGDIDWSIDAAKIYGMSFSAVEDLRP